MKKPKFRKALLGYLGFFALVAGTVTAAVLIFSAVQKTFDGNTAAISAIMLVVCFGLSLICATIDALRRRLTVDKAVEEISEATVKMASGNFNIRLQPHHSYAKYDDLDIIMDNLNKMADELSKNEILKSDFVSNVSHELKTPLAVIQNYAAALQNDNLSAEQRTAYSKTLVQTSAKLSTLVSNILKLNKLENQRLLPETQKIRLDESLAQAILDFDELIEAKNLEINCDIDEAEALTSPALVEIVWNNLLSNAIKFTPNGGRISVTLKRNANRAVVTVADTGCGMNKETGEHIFDKFYQGDTSHSAEGNGLGLALVKKVIDILGGEIHVESEPQKGSVFTVVLNGVERE